MRGHLDKFHKPNIVKAYVTVFMSDCWPKPCNLKLCSDLTAEGSSLASGVSLLDVAIHDACRVIMTLISLLHHAY